MQQNVCLQARPALGCVRLTGLAHLLAHRLTVDFPVALDDQMPLKFCCCSLIMPQLLSQTYGPNSFTVV